MGAGSGRLAGTEGLAGREWLAATLLSALGAAVLLWPALFGDRSTLSFELSDPRIDIRPWAATTQGELPEINPVTPDLDLFHLPGLIRLRQLESAGTSLWDGGQLGGYPFAGNQPFPGFSPFTWLTKDMAPVDAVDWLLWFHIAIAALLAYRAARMLGAGPPAAALAAVGFALSGWMSTRWHNAPNLYTSAWFGGLFAAAEWLRRGRIARGVFEGGLFLGLSLLSGFPQIGASMLAGFLLYVVLQRECRRPAALAGAALAALIGLALAAPQMVLSGSAYEQSLRSNDVTRAATAQQGLPPGALLGAVMPEFFGRPSDFAGPNPPAPSMKEWLPQRRLFSADLQDNVVENALYPGALLLLLLPLLLRGAVDPRARLLAWVALIGVGLTLLWPFAMRAVPALAVLGAGNVKRLIVLLGCALPLAGALGLQALIERRVRLPWRTAAGLILLVATLPWLAGAVDDPQADVFGDALSGQAWRQAAMLLAGLAALALMVRGRGLMRWLPALVLAIDLVGIAWAFNPFPPQHEAFPATNSLTALAQRTGRVAVLGTSNMLPPTAATLHGIRSLHGVSPMVPARHAELLALIEGPLHDERDPRILRPFLQRESLTHPLLDLLNVDTVVHADPGLAGATGWPVLFEHPEEGLAALVRPSAGPRAFLVGGAEVVTDKAERLARLASREFPVHDTALLEREPGVELPARGDMIPAMIRSERDDVLTLAVEASFAGILVLTEGWDPGWRATLDNQDTRVLVVDHALMGVAVSPGTHVVQFVYDPPGLMRAGALMITAVVALLLLLLGGAVRARAHGRLATGVPSATTPAS
jgi:hypothetical protein